MNIINKLFQPTGRHWVAFIILLFICYGCSQQNQQAEGKAEEISHLHSVRSQAKAEVQYAEGFAISYHPGYKLIKVFNPFVDRSDTLRYVLVPRGEEPPEAYPHAQVIETPVQSMIATSVTHVALAEMLEAGDIITGIAGAEYVYSPSIRTRLKKGQIIPFSEASLDQEKMLAMNPDLIMVAAGQASNFNDYRLFIKLGIPVFVNAEWLETTPLGKAEWVKAMAALLNKENMAKQKFGAVAKRYKELKRKVGQVEKRPLVINNMPYKGAWFVSGGQSFMAQYLRDAGADYPWFKNDERGGLRLSFEAVYAAGLRADIWINPGTATSLEDIMEADTRFRDFKSFQTGNIYNNTKRMTASGANDFWETGAVRPDLVLSDLINIFHPGLLQNDSLYFYQQLSPMH